MPLFSIVTVTLNCAANAVRTAQSVLAQDFDDYEYIVKDGGSQDGTIESLGRLGISPQVSPDFGIYDAMNQALALCQGDYIYFLNGGDTFFNNNVLRQLATQLDPTAAIIYGDVIRQPLGQRMSYPSTLTRYYLFRKNLCHQAWIVRRDVFKQFGGFLTKSPLESLHQPIASDQEFLWRILLQEELTARHVDLSIANFQHGGYSTQRHIYEQSRQERWLLLKRFFSGRELFFYSLRSFYFLNSFKAMIWHTLNSKMLNLDRDH